MDRRDVAAARKNSRGQYHGRGRGKPRWGNEQESGESSSAGSRGRGAPYFDRDRHGELRGGRRENAGASRGRGSERRYEKRPRNVGERRPTAVNLAKLAGLEPEGLVIQVNDQLKEFQEAIGDTKASMRVVVQVLSKLLSLAGKRDDAENQSIASKIIAEVLSERSDKFHFQLNRAVQGMSCTIVQAESFCNLFKSMLTMFESLARECLPIDELHETVKRLTKDGSTHSKLMEKAQELCEARDLMRSSQKEEKEANDDDEERDDSQFRLVPVLPEWNEIKEDSGIPHEVRPNRIDGPYKDWMEYYDIQFRLIREDFIAPLRRGVASFLQGRKNRDVKTYSAAKIVSQVTTKGNGICFTIKFDVTGFRRVNYNWDQSKRLIFGSLLCFIPMSNVASGKDTVLFATVADRDSRGLSRGTFMVQFEGDMLEAMTQCRNGTEFEIVESNSYFGATSPILQSIQRAEVATMPFTKQLIECECESVAPPYYLRHKEVAMKYDLSCLHGPMEKRKKRPPLTIEVLKKESWELARNSELDSSQLNAIQTALTQEIAVIQGPPGTGKTYIGLKTVEGLLQNRHIWDPRRSTPILVMCYTNHALDQFLEGIIDTECCGRRLEVIRVGGRCKNEKVDAHNLNKIRRNPQNRPRGNAFSTEFRRLKEEMEKCNPELIWQCMQQILNNHSTLLSLGDLQAVAHPNHYYQLTLIQKQQGREAEVWLGLWVEVMEVVREKRKESPASKQSPPVDQNNEVVKDEMKRFNTEQISKEGQVQEAMQTDEEELLDVEGDAGLAQDDRMDDDDVEGFKRAELPKSEREKTEPPVFSPDQDEASADDAEGEDEDEKTRENDKENEPKPVLKSRWYRRRDADNIIRRHVCGKDIMDDEEVEEISDVDLTGLSMKDRWRLYNHWNNHWREKYYILLQEENRRRVQEYSDKCRELAELRQREDRHILEKADVVGMTTTGAAKYQHILHHIKPKIVIVEEAAEVLEAHIVSALSAGTQHLILIGDHKQLRPKPNEHVLATKYNLSISLFERLVMKEMSQATLEIQHRMRPEIARLVCPHVYEKLLNHESVQKYPDVQGISKNMFFVCHTQPESENPNLLSYQNDFEAKYVAALCSHLLRLGYSPSQITILTPYVGQLLMLQNKLPKTEFEGVRVTAIDNFQGEENDIILFSMVRSTNPHSSRTTIGFVKEDNRVCVSLSRAKHGFYVIGNFELIRHQSPLWESIISDVESRGCYGKALPLYCCNHPETKFSAEKDTDFKANAPNGGCRRMCDIRLPCGHSCTQMCHITDRQHAKFRCKKTCERSCPYNHPCTTGHYCYIKCPRCREIVERVIPECGHKQEMECWVEDPQCQQVVAKIMPGCGHQQNMPCSTDPLTVFCNAPCAKILCTNRHLCQKACFEDCGKCVVDVEKVIPVCNHKQMVPCFQQPALLKCQMPCPKLCSNKLHPCPKTCSQSCGKCRVVVQKPLPTCGHTQNTRCYKEPDPAKCRSNCEKLCPNGLHTIKKLCLEEWPQCNQKVVKKLPKCGHTVEGLCHEEPSAILCNKPCERFCEFGHKCTKLCHKKCAPCLSKVTKTLPCGHTHVMSCSNPLEKCTTKCLKERNCGKRHICRNTCHFPEPCGPCSEVVTVKMSTCSHVQHTQCYESQNPTLYGVTCQHPCEKKLECGHMCKKKCGDFCQVYCKEILTIDLICGHNAKVECHRKTSKGQLSINCKFPVHVKIGCGHTIRTECWKQKYRSSLKRECKQRCNKVLKCGHVCQETCGSTCTRECKAVIKKRRRSCGHKVECDCCQAQHIDLSPCTEMCRKKLTCGHPCKNECGEPCSTCNNWSTRKYPCGHSSKIPCDATIEEYPCQTSCKFVLSCGHRCSGKCGDCYSSRIHAVCIFEIKLRRFCGHSLTLPCAGLSDSCDHGTHQVPCTHGEDYSKCGQLCSWDCKHYQCGRKCGEECARPPCNEACDKELSCGHPCPGLCGERCTTVCVECEPQKFMKQFHPKPKKGRLPRNEPFFELGCGHIFTVPYLDEYMGNSGGAVLPKQCPRCHQTIGVGSRYGNVVRGAQTDVQNVTIERDLRLGHGQVLLPENSHNICVYRDFRIVWRSLDTIAPESSEKRFLVRCVDSCYTFFLALQALVKGNPDSLFSKFERLSRAVVNLATKEPQSKHEYRRMGGLVRFEERKRPKLHLTFQLITDFKSELYRLALHAQCLVAKNPHQLIVRAKRTGYERVVQDAQHYLDTLNPVEDRISEKVYERYYRQIAAVVPDVASLHIQTPQAPLTVKGTWTKCPVGHYHCSPPFRGAVAKDAVRCPDCTKL